MDCPIPVSSMATVLQLVLCNTSHDMSQSHKINPLDIASIELIIVTTHDIMWMATSCCPINFKRVLTLDVPSQS
jgi:hypothetical protein